MSLRSDTAQIYLISSLEFRAWGSGVRAGFRIRVAFRRFRASRKLEDTGVVLGSGGAHRVAPAIEWFLTGLSDLSRALGSLWLRESVWEIRVTAILTPRASCALAFGMPESREFGLLRRRHAHNLKLELKGEDGLRFGVSSCWSWGLGLRRGARVSLQETPGIGAS